MLALAGGQVGLGLLELLQDGVRAALVLVQGGLELGQFPAQDLAFLPGQVPALLGRGQVLLEVLRGGQAILQIVPLLGELLHLGLELEAVGSFGFGLGAGAAAAGRTQINAAKVQGAIVRIGVPPGIRRESTPQTGLVAS